MGSWVEAAGSARLRKPVKPYLGSEGKTAGTERSEEKSGSMRATV